MAERRIKTYTLFTAQALSAGGSATSRVIPLRDDVLSGKFSLFASVAAGTAGTAGTTVVTYSGCTTEDGTFITPVAAISIGTFGTSCLSDIIDFDPELMPFMKIVATQSGSGNAGRDSKISAELNVQ